MEFDLMVRYFLDDVGITHPASSTYLRVAQYKLGAAKRYENEKKQNYALLSTSENVRMFPFILESFGAFGSEADQFISLVTTHANDYAGTTVSGFRKAFVEGISVLLQR